MKKVTVTVTVDVDALGDLADKELDRTGIPEFIQDAAIGAVKSGLSQAMPFLSHVVENRFGEFAEVSVKAE